MKAQIIQIGNSQGIRIPKMMLEEGNLSGEVELELREEGILIRNIRKPRGDWDARFSALAETDDDQVLSESSSAFDKKEWQW
ncbi:MAG: AbrB/MazE/SpoVT family DNA-binding domain-containing protein [Acidobacteriota bacterium]